MVWFPNGPGNLQSRCPSVDCSGHHSCYLRSSQTVPETVPSRFIPFHRNLKQWRWDSSGIPLLPLVVLRRSSEGQMWDIQNSCAQAISLGTFFADRNTLLLLRFLAGLAEGNVKRGQVGVLSKLAMPQMTKKPSGFWDCFDDLPIGYQDFPSPFFHPPSTQKNMDKNSAIYTSSPMFFPQDPSGIPWNPQIL